MDLRARSMSIPVRAPPTFNHLDLFSGIGVFALGLKLAGIKTGAHYFSDVSAHANAIYSRHFPKAQALGDARSVNGCLLRRRHAGRWMLTGGFPCQDIANAGPRDGLAGRRSNLWWEMHRIIGELRPAFVLAENVPPLCRRGLERVLLSLAHLGYDAEWEVVSAASIGAPHVRKRIWIAAYPSMLRRVAAVEVHARGRHVADRWHIDGPHSWDLPWSAWPEVAASGSILSQPLIGRVDDGIPPWLDRVTALGNAVVPQLVAQILRREP